MFGQSLACHLGNRCRLLKLRPGELLVHVVTPMLDLIAERGCVLGHQH